MKNVIDLFKKIWIKIIIQILMLSIMWFFYFFSSKILPKKYRITDNYIKKFLKNLSVLLNNAPANGEERLLSLFAKTKNVFEHFLGVDETSAHAERELEKYFDTDNNLEKHEDYYFMNLIFPKIKKVAKKTLIKIINANEEIIQYSFIYQDNIVEFFVVKIKEIKSNRDDLFNLFFYCTKGVNYKKLTNILFEITENKLYLYARNSELLLCEKLGMDFNQENYILNEKIYNELLTEITRFKNKNIQRSYMLVGPAGTGKSTFCLELSKRISGKIVKLDSNTFNNLDDSMTKNLIENLECDFIIVDDIDRISYAQNTARFLYMLEYMKEFKTKPTLLVTVNNILELDKAVLRPGRFDDIIEFNYPTKNERKDFIAKYFIKLNKNVSQDHINAIANVTNGMTQAYLKEYCFQYIIENNIQKLITKIKKRKKFVEMSNIKCVSDNDMKELLMKDNSQINAKTLRGVARLK